MPETLEITPIREFILRNVGSHPQITNYASQTLGISRQAVVKHVKQLIDAGFLTAEGTTKARRYSLARISGDIFTIELSHGLSESAIWQHKILPHLKGIPENILGLCEYGFTEIFNNAIDHSRSSHAEIIVSRNYATILLMVQDQGVGIFEKIRNDHHLEDARTALLELSKGKLTSDPQNHAGEGIFFTSRMFDKFSIESGHLFYLRRKEDDDEWLIETEDRFDFMQGTSVAMSINTDANWNKQQVFDAFQTEGNIGFRKTHVPIRLSKMPGEQLVSRSQAKRILARFEKFAEIFLDFQGVDDIGQAFADEIFRVFKNTHPEIRLIAINKNSNVEKMINYVLANAPQE